MFTAIVFGFFVMMGFAIDAYDPNYAPFANNQQVYVRTYHDANRTLGPLDVPVYMPPPEWFVPMFMKEEVRNLVNYGYVPQPTVKKARPDTDWGRWDDYNEEVLWILY